MEERNSSCPREARDGAGRPGGGGEEASRGGQASQAPANTWSGHNFSLRQSQSQFYFETILNFKILSGISDGDYTSLYFKDAENQYEQIEGESKYGLRTMKDSLLKVKRTLFDKR